MDLQPNLLAVNTLPPVFASRGTIPEPEAVREVAPAEPVKPIIDGFYVSPLLRFDNQALALIFQVRDSESGEVQRQFPRESVVERLRSNPGGDVLPGRQSDDEAAAEVQEVRPLLASEPTEEGAAPATGTVNGVETSNGAPAIGGTSAGTAPELGGVQSVDVLV